MTTLVKKANLARAPRAIWGSKYTLTRQQYLDVMERVLDTMGAHFREYERERLRDFAFDVERVTFGTWNLKPGCPLQQTGMCTSNARLDSVTTLFVDHYDAAMRELWGLDRYSQGIVKIIP